MKTSQLQPTVLALLLAGFRTLAAEVAENQRAWQLRTESQQAVKLPTRGAAGGGEEGGVARLENLSGALVTTVFQLKMR